MLHLQLNLAQLHLEVPPIHNFIHLDLKIRVGKFSTSADIKIINIQFSSNMLIGSGNKTPWIHAGNTGIHLFSSIRNTSHMIKVENCTFEFGVNLSGLVLTVSKSWDHLSCLPLESNIPETYTVHVFNTKFHYNFCDNIAGCGLSIVISNETCHDTNMYIKNTMFDNNKSRGIGGNILISADIFQSSNHTHTIKIDNVTVSNGLAFYGAGLYLYTGSSFAHDPSSE